MLLKRVLEMTELTGHFTRYPHSVMLDMPYGEIAVTMNHGFHGSEESRERILHCIERCRKLLGCKRTLTEREKEKAIKHFMAALSDKLLKIHYALGGDRWTVEPEDSPYEPSERYYTWDCETPRTTVAKMAVARFMLGEA